VSVKSKFKVEPASVGAEASNSKMSARKALLLRVGMDLGTGGALGPIFRDGAFEYIPIPETAPSRCRLTYASLPGRRVPSLALVLPRRLADRLPHIDPDFDAWTYGDAAPRKRRQLLHLSLGDLLLFYAGLAPVPPNDRPRLFAIGSLRVRRVHDLRARDLARLDLRRRFGGTSHFMRRVPDQELALVEGDPNEGGLFAKAIPFGDGRDSLLSDLAALGYSGSILRSVGHWVEGVQPLATLEAWLREGPVSLVDPDSRLIQVSAAAISGGEGGRDLAINDTRLRVSDWAVAHREDGGLHVFGRVNRIVTASGSRKAFCSIFWLLHGGELPRCGSGKAQASLTRMVACFSRNYRIGFHRLAAHR
jgi:Nucleotide modification associated domain 3